MDNFRFLSRKNLAAEPAREKRSLVNGIANLLAVPGLGQAVLGSAVLAKEIPAAEIRLGIAQLAFKSAAIHPGLVFFLRDNGNTTFIYCQS